MNRTLKISFYIVLIITFIIQIAICDQDTKIIQNNNSKNNIDEIEEELLIDNFKIAKDTEIEENEINNGASSPISRNQENNEIYKNNNNNKKSTTQMIDTSIINSNKECKIIESCRRCQENEIQPSFCKDTNSFRVKLSCKNRGELYRSCNINNHNNNIGDGAINDGYINDTNINQIEKKSAINILYFEIGVLVVFIFSIYFVKERKRLSQIQNNEKLQKIIDKNNQV